MDDFNLQTLRHSQNDQCSRLLDLLTPSILQGFQFIFTEAVAACNEAGEPSKYLKTFQNLILRIPKWNDTIIDMESRRIIKESNCDYLEDLLTCTHIIHLKMLTIARVGDKQKTINIDIPKLNDFIHRVYMDAARKIYRATFLYESGLPPLQQQKNRHELEYLIKDAILMGIRQSIPTERILRAYMSESIEEDVTEEIKEEIVPVEPIQDSSQSDSIDANASGGGGKGGGGVSFNHTDHRIDLDGTEDAVHAPKDVATLENISRTRYEERKAADALEEGDINDGDGDGGENGNETLVIGDDISLHDLDIDMNIQSLDADPIQPPSLMNVEILQ